MSQIGPGATESDRMGRCWWMSGKRHVCSAYRRACFGG